MRRLARQMEKTLPPILLHSSPTKADLNNDIIRRTQVRTLPMLVANIANRLSEIKMEKRHVRLIMALHGCEDVRSDVFQFLDSEGFARGVAATAKASVYRMRARILRLEYNRVSADEFMRMDLLNSDIRSALLKNIQWKLVTDWS